MRLHACTLITTALLLGACGDDAPGDDSTGSTSTASTTDASTGTPPATSSSGGATDSGSSGGSSSGSDSGTATQGDTTEGDTTAGDTTMGSSSGESTTSGGTASLEISMSGLQIFQDCMPIVSPDPVGVSFDLDLTNTGDVPGSATILSATFVNGMGVDVGTFDVMPTDLGPVDVGGNATVPVSKVNGSLMPPNACGVVMCNQVYTVEVEIDVDGMTSVVSDTANVGCVF